MSAIVRKMPKEYRVAQRWRAECDDHMGKGHNNVKPRTRGSGYEPWTCFLRRRAKDAAQDMQHHNAVHHPRESHEWRER